MAAIDASGLLPRALQAAASRYGGNTVGAILIVFSSLTLAAMMAAVKDLSATYSVWQILMARSLGQLVILAPIMVQSGGTVLKSARIDLQIMRVLFAFVGIACGFYAIAHLPLAEASAISFCQAIFVVALAAPIFAEKVGAIGWMATAIGLSGVVVMLDPTADVLNVAALVGVAGAFANALVVIAVKKLTTSDATATIMSYPAIGLTLLCGGPATFYWHPITWEAAPLFVLTMFSGVITTWCFINSYRFGEASVMATVEYSRLIAAAVVGYLVFFELPTPDGLIGVALIISASLIAIRRDRITEWFNR